MPTRQKQCSLDCVYCQHAGTEACKDSPPTTTGLIQAIEEGFAELALRGEVPDRITIAGSRN